MMTSSTDCHDRETSLTASSSRRAMPKSPHRDTSALAGPLCLCPEILVVEPQHAMPHVLRCRRAIARSVVRKEGMAGVAIHSELVSFAVSVEFFLEAGGMRR